MTEDSTIEQTKKALNLSPNHEAIWEVTSHLVGIALGILEGAITNPVQLTALKRQMEREIYEYRAELCKRIE